MTNANHLEGLVSAVDEADAATLRANGVNAVQLRAFALTATEDNGWCVDVMLRRGGGGRIERGKVADSTPKGKCYEWERSLLRWMKKNAVTAVSVDAVHGLNWDGFIERQARLEQVEFKTAA